MKTKINVTIVNNQKKIDCEAGISANELLQYIEKDHHIAAKINNKVTSLSYKIRVNSTVEFISKSDNLGMEVYRRSLSFLLAKVTEKLFPERKLIIGHSLGPGYYFDLIGDVLTEETVNTIKHEMRNEIYQNKSIVRDKMSYTDALAYFKSNNREDKYKLLSGLNMSKLSIYRCDDFFEIFDGPLALNTGELDVFDLIYYEPGFILQFPKRSQPDRVAHFTEQRRIFEVYRESKKIGKILKVDNVGNLNDIIMKGEIDNFIQIAENLQYKQIIRLADEVHEKKRSVKLIAIAGPSSSGKTTFSKKLSLQLQTLGLTPFTISIDNYFVDREKTPLDKNGKPDYESLEALNIDLLNENLTDLMNGKRVRLPEYNFYTGLSSFSKKEIELKSNEIVVIEGIHCLNDKLTASISDNQKFKIYVSALTQINLDNNNRIPTTDNRLIRRMVRDYKYRGHSAKHTFNMWGNVRSGEEKHIFPFQNSADGYFNSALDYELAILKPFAEPLLMQIKPNDEEYAEAIRLQKFLSYFLNIPSNNVPSTSIIREFIGGSFFNY